MAHRTHGSMHVATTTRTCQGKVYVSHLLRRSFREGGKVKHQTLGNLSHLPPDLIDTIRQRLTGEMPTDQGPWEIVRSLPHGHVAAVLGTLRQIGIERMLASRPSRERSLAIAMIVMRLLAPQSRLVGCRGLKTETATTSLAVELGLGEIAEEELYHALDWLGSRQPRIETKLARRHIQDGALVLYDVSSGHSTGQPAGLVQFGHDHDGKKGFPQIIYGLLCNAEGCPVAIEVFQGKTADPNTLNSQIEKLRKRFGVTRVVLVGDRDMIISKRIDESLRDVKGLELKAIDLHARPIYRWLDEPIKAHVFLCMLSYHVEWHMRKQLATILLEDHDKESVEASRKDIAAPAPHSEAAKCEELTQRTAPDEPLHSFRSLLADLGTLCMNRVRLLSDRSVEFYLLTRPTRQQQHALSLLGVAIQMQPENPHSKTAITPDTACD